MPEEREVKFEVADGFQLPRLDGVLPGIVGLDRGVHQLEATYWDTPQMDLFRLGCGLRFRTTDASAGTWTMKANAHRDGAAIVRSEVDISAPPDSPPPGMLELLPATVDPAALRPVARITTQRHVIDLMNGGARWAEVADDHVAVLRQHQVVETFHEVELEITGDDVQQWTDQMVALFVQAGARVSAGKGKHARALEALGLLPQTA